MTTTITCKKYVAPQPSNVKWVDVVSHTNTTNATLIKGINEQHLAHFLKACRGFLDRTDKNNMQSTDWISLTQTLPLATSDHATCA